MRKARIETVSQDGLNCFYSRLDEFTEISRQDALACHRVIDTIFRETAVIPIRFPTLVNGEQDLRVFLRKQQAKYAAALARLRDSIQMELLISLSADRARPDPSGKAYLERRSRATHALARAAEEARAHIHDLATGWRTSNGKQRDSLRCYALIGRAAERDFRNRIESMPEAPGIEMAVSGPWPCTEFLE